MQSTGYPVHISIEEFVDRYASAILHDATLPMTAHTCTRVLSHADVQQVCVGRTKVFLKPWHVDQLEALLKLRIQSAKMMQNGILPSASSSSPPPPHHHLPTITSSPPHHLLITSPSPSHHLLPITPLQLSEGIRSYIRTQR